MPHRLPPFLPRELIWFNKASLSPFHNGWDNRYPREHWSSFYFLRQAKVFGGKACRMALKLKMGMLFKDLSDQGGECQAP